MHTPKSKSKAKYHQLPVFLHKASKQGHYRPEHETNGQHSFPIVFLSNVTNEYSTKCIDDSEGWTSNNLVF